MRAPLQAAAVATLALALATTGALAQSQSKSHSKSASAEKSLGSGKSTGRVLTRDELRACMARQADQHTKREAIVKSTAELDKEEAGIHAEAEAIKEAREALDRTSQEAIDGFNKRLLANDERIDAFNKRKADLAAEATAWQNVQNDWTVNCGDRRYREDDETAIKRGK